MGTLLGMLGLLALVVSLIGLVRGRVGWARLPSRKAAAAVLVGSLVLISIGAALTPSQNQNSASSSARSSSTATASPTAATPTPTPRISHAPDGTAMPDQQLTPGSALPASAAVVCTPGNPSSVQDVSEDVGRGVFAAYVVDYTQRVSYELDHLVPVELGGDNSEHNLWPQPRIGPKAADLKDRLETHLHDLVCAGSVPLAEAQLAMSGDWLAANARYGPMTIPPPPAPVITTPPLAPAQPAR